MNYAEIKTAAYAYADRDDTETQDRYDDFLRIVESKVNRRLKTLDSAETDVTAIAATISQIAAPADFGGVRRLIYTDSTGIEHGMKLAAPHVTDQEFKIREYRQMPNDIFYSVSNGAINFSHEFEDGSITLHYYRKVPELTAVATTNWLSDDFPDAYIFGVRTEIAAFVKNMDSASQWESRLEKIISEMIEEDKDRRWSGEPMQIRVE